MSVVPITGEPMLAWVEQVDRMHHKVVLIRTATLPADAHPTEVRLTDHKVWTYDHDHITILG